MEIDGAPNPIYDVDNKSMIPIDQADSMSVASIEGRMAQLSTHSKWRQVTTSQYQPACLSFTPVYLEDAVIFVPDEEDHIEDVGQLSDWCLRTAAMLRVPWEPTVVRVKLFRSEVSRKRDKENKIKMELKEATKLREFAEANQEEYERLAATTERVIAATAKAAVVGAQEIATQKTSPDRIRITKDRDYNISTGKYVQHANKRRREDN
jgi:hypothetical protein